MFRRRKLKPQVILGVAAHADDLDYWAGGAIAKYAAEGALVYLLVLTDGGKGTSDPGVSPAGLIALRQDEQRTAAKILGVTDVFFERFEDGALTDSPAVRAAIVRRIRELQPDVVIGWDPSYWYCRAHGLNHPDHQAAGAATNAAVYPLARDHLSFPELLAEGLPPHRVATVLMINPEHANFRIHIRRYLRIKLEALRAHISQPGLANQRFTHRPTESFVRIDQPQ